MLWLPLGQHTTLFNTFKCRKSSTEAIASIFHLCTPTPNTMLQLHLEVDSGNSALFPLREALGLATNGHRHSSTLAKTKPQKQPLGEIHRGVPCLFSVAVVFLY